MRCAPAATWLLVKTSPSSLKITPVPTPWLGTGMFMAPMPRASVSIWTIDCVRIFTTSTVVSSPAGCRETCTAVGTAPFRTATGVETSVGGGDGVAVRVGVTVAVGDDVEVGVKVDTRGGVGVDVTVGSVVGVAVATLETSTGEAPSVGASSGEGFPVSSSCPHAPNASMRTITTAIPTRDRPNISRIRSFAFVALGGGVPYPGGAREGCPTHRTLRLHHRIKVGVRPTDRFLGGSPAWGGARAIAHERV